MPKTAAQSANVTTVPFVTIGNTNLLGAERSLTGTSNQITVTDNGANSTVVLSLPQNIHTAATPQFSVLGLGGAALSTQAIYIGSSLSGSAFQYAVNMNPTFGTDATSQITGCQVSLVTANSGSAYTIANSYGFLIGNPTKGTNATITTNYGLYIVAQTSGATNYAIYSAGGTNYFSGSVGIGASTAPPYILEVRKDSAVTGQGNTASPIFAVTNANTTANNWAEFDFCSDGSGTGAVFISAQFVSHTAPEGKLFIGTKDSAGAFANRLVIGSGNVVAPAANKTQDLGSTTARWNNIFYVTATTGTSRMVESEVMCKDCGNPMQRGTGVNIVLGKDFDYTQVYCFECGTTGIEKYQHLTEELRKQMKQPDFIRFKGFQVQALSGNTRTIKVDFQYSEDKLFTDGQHKGQVEEAGLHNSTVLGETEITKFMNMAEEERREFLLELGQREWEALEEARLMRESVKDEQESFNELLQDYIGKNL